MQRMWISQASLRVRAGFLCEHMGMGKTVEMLALVLSKPAPATVVNGAAVDGPDGVKLTATRATLVVCKVRHMLPIFCGVVPLHEVCCTRCQ